MCMCVCMDFKIMFIYIYVFFLQRFVIYLAASGLSHGMLDLCCIIQDLSLPMGLVFPWHVGSWFPNQEWNPCPLHCKADS